MNAAGLSVVGVVGHAPVSAKNALPIDPRTFGGGDCMVVEIPLSSDVHVHG